MSEKLDLPPHIAGDFGMIAGALDEARRAIPSPHLARNLVATVRNALAFLEADTEIERLAGEFLFASTEYAKRRDIYAFSEKDKLADNERFIAAEAALERLRVALARSKPSETARKLGLG